jgi:hypothetical protein
MGRQGLWLMQHKVTAQALQEKGSCSAFAHLVTAIYFFKDCFSREEIKLVLNAPFWSGIKREIRILCGELLKLLVLFHLFMW